MGVHIGPGVLAAVVFWVASSAGGASEYDGHYAGTSGEVSLSRSE